MSRTTIDRKRSIIYNIDVTTTVKRVSEISYPDARVTFLFVLTNRRVAIGNNNDIKVGNGGFEIAQNVPHYICEDPQNLFIISDNDVTVMVQVERDWR